MTFLDLVLRRRSIRKYKTDPIPEDTIRYVLETARHAPSWANQQCWKYIVVTDEDLKKEIASMAPPPSSRVPPPSWDRNLLPPLEPRPRDWAARAPVIIVGCADPTKSGRKEGKDYYLVDMGISMEHLILAAAEQGLGTCWIGGGFNEENVKKALGIPDEIRVVALTPLGYPDEQPSPRPRRSFDE
ncbi:MAG: nitroreductase family protein, partial [Candidatus Bathyarchaeia archaeon]